MENPPPPSATICRSGIPRVPSRALSSSSLLDSVEALPAQPYTKEELRAYLASARQTCHTTLSAMTDEQARRPVAYPWSAGQPISYLELQLYNMRHVQEHAAQLSLFLGQHAIPDADLDWVAGVKGTPSGQ